MKTNHTLRSARLSLLLGSSMLAASTASAQTWTGASDNLWTSAGNWTGGAPDPSPTGTSTVTFHDTGAGNLSNNTGGFYNLNQIAFNAEATSPVTINVTATSLDLTTTPGTAIRFNAGTNLSVAAGDHKIIGTGVSSGNAYDVIFNGATSSTHTFDIATGASFEIQGRLHHGSFNNKNYSKTGGGTLIFSGPNGGSNVWSLDSSKAFQVQQGAMRFALSAASGFSGNNYTVSSGAAIELTGGTTQTVTNGNWTLNGTGMGNAGAIRSLSGNNNISAANTATGTIALATASSIGVDSGTLTIRKVISGSGSLTKVGAGTLVLNGTYSDNTTPYANTFTGATAISAGILSLVGPDLLLGSTLDTTASIVGDASNGLRTNQTTLKLGGLSGNKNLAAIFTTSTGGYDAVTTVALSTPVGQTPNYAGAIEGDRALTQAGPGAQTLSGANTYTGGSNVTGGGLSFLNTTAKSPNGTHTFAAGTTLGLGVSGAGAFTTTDLDNAFAGNMTGDLSGITLDATTSIGIDTTLGNFTYTAANASPRGLAKVGANSLILTGTSTYTGPTVVLGGTLQVQGSIATSSGISNSAELVFNSASAQSFANPISGTGILTKQGAGTLTLSGTNTYTGTTTVTGGVLLLDNATALPGGLGGSGGTSNLTLNGGVVGLTTASGNIQRSLGTGATNLRWSASGGFAAYGGDRTVNIGGSNATLQWNATNFVPAGSALILGATNADATITFANRLNFANGNRTIQVNNGSAAVDAILNQEVGVSGGQNGGLVKTGAGTLALTNNSANSYTGATAVNAGTLQFGNGGTTGGLAAIASNITVAAGATLAVNRSNTFDQTTAINNRVIAGDGGFAQIGSGTTIFTAANTYTGPTTVSVGILQIGNGGTTGTLGNSASNTTVAAGAQLIINRTATFGYDFYGEFTGSGTVTINPNMRMNLRVDQPNSGNLSFELGSSSILGINTGGTDNVTNVHLGELTGTGNIQRAGTAAAVPVPVVITIGGKNTNCTYSGNITNIAEFALVKTGTGTLTFEGNIQHGGTTTVASGTLALGSAGTIPNSSAFTIAAGAVFDVDAKASFALPAGKTFTFGVNSAGSGTTGSLTAQTLDITNAVVALDVTGTLDDAAYVLATYTSLSGTKFGTEPTVPTGYKIDYAYQGNKIALVPDTGGSSPYQTWAGAGVSFTADANNDGVKNGLAFLLGAEGPNDPNALGLLPDPSQNNGAFVMQFQAIPAAARGTATLKLGYSNSLAPLSWTSVTVPGTTGVFTDDPVVSFSITDSDLDDPANPLDVTATISEDAAEGGKLFGRLGATE